MGATLTFGSNTDTGAARVTGEIVNVTPEMAASFLAVAEEHHNNRKINPRWVNQLAGDFAGGRYVFDGAPLRFNSSGVMVDGQHRCAAIVKSGVTVPILVVRGVRDDAFLVMDTGRARTLANMLDISGMDTSRLVASAAVMHWDYEHHWKRSMYGQSAARPSIAQLVQWTSDHPDLQFCANRIASSKKNGRLFTQAPFVVAYYLWRMIDKEDAETVRERIAGGTGLASDDPCYRAREWAINVRARRKGCSGSHHRRIQLAILNKAWNFSREGRTCKYLVFRINEQFPVPI